MVKRHLKRCATPKTWKIKRKGTPFIARPNPGAHPMSLSLPMSVVMKTIIKAANTTKEVKKLLYSKEVLVDGKRVKNHRFPVGLMDAISIAATKQFFRMVFDSKGHLTVAEIDEKEAKQKLCKIAKKTLIRGGKVQLNLSDGKNIIIDKGEYNLGDSVLIELPSQKITNHFKFEKGAVILLFAGKHIAEEGVIENIEGSKIIFKNTKGESVTTSKKYAFVVGKDKPALKVK